MSADRSSSLPKRVTKESQVAQESVSEKPAVRGEGQPLGEPRGIRRNSASQNDSIAFQAIPTELLDAIHYARRPLAYVVYAALDWFAFRNSKDGYSFYIGFGEIAARAGVSKPLVIKEVAWLEQKGFITIERIGGGRGKAHWYHVPFRHKLGKR